jgi:chromate transporter
VIAIVANAALNFGTAISWSILMILIVAAAFAALRFKIDILWVVLAGAVISIFIL